MRYIPTIQNLYQVLTISWDGMKMVLTDVSVAGVFNDLNLKVAGKTVQEVLIDKIATIGTNC